MRLRLPTPGLVGSPHVHSSCLGPVSFAGLLIECLHFAVMSWAFAQFRPNVALRGHLCAVLGMVSRGVLGPVIIFSIGIPDVTCPQAASTIHF